MMETPILTPADRRKSLKKKKTPEKSLRNVLCKPYLFNSPVLSAGDGDILCKLLKSTISPFERKNIKIPWSHLRELSKEERLKMKKEKMEMENKEHYKYRQFIQTGLNNIARSIEKNRLHSVLLEANIEPPFLTRHLVTMCHHKQIACLLVPNLSSVLKSSLGYSSISIAFKKTAENSKETKELLEMICSFSKAVSIPDKVEPSDTSTENLSHNAAINPFDNGPNKDVSEKKEIPLFEVQEKPDIYLRRTSKHIRAFDPFCDNTKGSDFLRFQESQCILNSNFSPCKKYKETCLNPVIKKLRPNPKKYKKNRKRKIQE